MLPPLGTVPPLKSWVVPSLPEGANGGAWASWPFLPNTTWKSLAGRPVVFLILARCVVVVEPKAGATDTSSNPIKKRADAECRMQNAECEMFWLESCAAAPAGHWLADLSISSIVGREFVARPIVS